MGNMQRMKSRAAIAAIGLIPATVILASACSNGTGPGDKAGPANQPVVLRMADLNAGSDLRGTPEIQYFVQRVNDLSRGKMSVKVVYSVGGLATNAEQQVVKDVADGSFDVGFAGTSVFDTLGVPSFQALSAPMLIDSYPLENAVIRQFAAGQDDGRPGQAGRDRTGGRRRRNAQAGRGAAAHLESSRLAGHHVRDLSVENRGSRHSRPRGKARPGIRNSQRPGPRQRCSCRALT